MATVTKDKIVVDELTKYGFKVGEEYVNFSKQLSETDKAAVVPGASFEAEMYVADSGKRYLNKVLTTTVPAKDTKAEAKKEIPKVETLKTKTNPEFKAKADTAMTKADWEAKDRSQLIGGLSHDAATLVAAMIHTVGYLVTAEEVVTSHKQVLEGLLKNRDAVK